MTGDAAADALIARGLDPSTRNAKQALFDAVLRSFGERGGTPPEHLWWVPGRLEVFGKHTDYAGGRTLVAALPRGFAFAAAPLAEDRVRVLDARTGESLSIDLSSDRPLTRWGHYVDVVVRRLAKNFPGAPLRAALVLASDLPAAAGMSSSSALLVGVATALIRIARIDDREEWRTNIHGTLDAAAYLACIENGKTFGTLIGDAGVGTHGGSEDHTAILDGRAGHLSAYSFVPPAPIATPRMPESWRFAIAPSGVVAEKTGAVRDAYNRMSAGVSVLLELWTRAEGSAPSLGAALREHRGGEGRLRDLIRAARIPDWSTDALERRLEHFVREDARIPAAVAVFESADADGVGRLALESQRDAERLLGNQIDETSALARSARERGAFAACSFGAGFGGSVWALVPTPDASAFSKRWHPDAFVASPGPALTRL